MENNKIRVTVSLFFKATGSKMGGGETLYCASKIDLNTENLIEFDLREYAQSQVEGLAVARYILEQVLYDIEHAPVAFDKEKVIEELKGEIELVAHNPMIAGRYIKKSRVIEIVEKGGIE